MPLKDREARRAYVREWYRRPENTERVKAKARAYKKLRKINRLHDERMAKHGVEIRIVSPDEWGAV